MGEAMAILNKELAQKGMRAETLFSIIMPETYVCLPMMHTDPEEKVKRKVDEASRRMSHIISTIKECRKGVVELEKGPVPMLLSYVIGSYFNRQMVNDKGFAVDTAVCIQCGKCANVCPVDNIEGTPPKWLHNGQCTSCLACYHYCPVHAISKGERTKKRGQYYFRPPLTPPVGGEKGDQ
jgi:ferredoxin